MHPGNESAELAQHIFVVQFRRAAASARRDRDPEIAAVMQCCAIQCEGRDNRNIRVRKLDAETVLLEDCLVAPARRPIEFRDHRLPIFDANLIDAILIAIQCQESTIALKAEFLHRRENVVGLELGVRER